MVISEHCTIQFCKPSVKNYKYPIKTAILRIMNKTSTLEQRSAWTLDALDYLDQGISVFDQDLRLIACNKRMTELLEIPEELALINQHISEFFRFNALRGEYGEGDIDELVTERVKLAESFEPHVFDRIRPDGTIIEVRGNPMEHNGGFVTTYTDVTEVRQSEARLEKRVIKRTEAYRRESEAHRETAEALHKSESWIRQIADAVPALIAYVDKDNCYQFINNMHQEWFGLDREQLIGCSIFSLVEDRNKEQFEKDIASVASGKEVSSEYMIRRKGRKPLDVSITFIPHFDSDEKVLGYFFLGQDLSEYKQTERELIESQKMQALGRLTGGIAHDFNNLLTIILGNLNFIEDDTIDNEEMREVIHACQQAAKRGGELIQRLLTFSRRQALKPESTDINALVEDFSILLQRTLGETVQVQRRLGLGLAQTLVDKNQLETCLLNLTLNARDAMPKGGKLTIRTQTYKKPQHHDTFTDLPAGDYIMLSVRDEGDGMSAETISRAFEPFYTTKPSGVGTGLGLSMVYGFVKQSGGGIDIKSKMGEGTTIRIIFPIDKQSAVNAEEQLPKLSDEQQNARILLVEDDEGVRQFVHRTLNKMGYTVDIAENGDFALDQLSQNPEYDLVLTDIVMPGSVSGLDLYDMVPQDYPKTKVLCMTGYSEQLESSLNEDHLLRKPFQRASLADKLQSLLNDHHA
ncbi:hybrid sensor histidine kinase/response regulator [Leucothrix pacifica]|uniref:histidine kinase n=2 Tax=Leucothrix pacifica TaxID=1247513 RepID=A0A317CLT2_9GAMM|nr:hybrid sensor histidine kinase/response regulator [Leucothrix pacifica]